MSHLSFFSHSVNMEYQDRWNPRSRRGANFHPANPRQQDAVPSITPYSYYSTDRSEQATEYEIYTTIKMLASFINRNNVIGTSVKNVARNLYDDLRAQRNREATTSFGTLRALAELSEHREETIFCNLYRYLYQFFNIYLHDLETRNPRHKCNRGECELHCILPLYSNRCMSDTKVMTLFSGLEDVLDKNPTLISSTEAKTARNLLKFVATFGDGSMKDSYDVLYAMSGHCGVICDPMAFVDSKLYELLFDHLVLFGTTPSLPWLGEEPSEGLRREVSQLERQDSRENVRFDVGDNDEDFDDDDDSVFVSEPSASTEARDAPPSYDSVVKPDHEDYQLPMYEEAVIDTVKKLQTETRV